MADANTNVQQHAEDAQHLDNMTSLQQQPQGSEGVGPQTAGSNSNVTPQSTPAPDGPSLYNAGTGTNDARPNYTSAGQDSGLDGAGVNGAGPGSNSNINGTIRNDGGSNNGANGGAETATQQSADAVNPPPGGGNRGGNTGGQTGATRPGGPNGGQPGVQGGEGAQGANGGQGNGGEGGSPTPPAGTNPAPNNTKVPLDPTDPTNPDVPPGSPVNPNEITSGIPELHSITVTLNPDGVVNGHQGGKVDDEANLTYTLKIDTGGTLLEPNSYARVVIVDQTTNTTTYQFVQVTNPSTTITIPTDELHGHQFSVYVDSTQLYTLNAGTPPSGLDNPDNYTGTGPQLNHLFGGNTTSNPDTFTVEDDRVFVSISSDSLHTGSGKVDDEGSLTYTLHVDARVDATIGSNEYAKVRVHIDGTDASTDTFKYVALNSESPSFTVSADEAHGKKFIITVEDIGTATDSNGTSFASLIAGHPGTEVGADYTIGIGNGGGAISDTFTVEDDRVFVSISSDSLHTGSGKVDDEGSLTYTLHVDARV
ncbi:hypothetical protein FD973_06545, partial [Polynucleobacter sp. MWH-Braz-FAM2G]